MRLPITLKFKLRYVFVNKSTVSVTFIFFPRANILAFIVSGHFTSSSNFSVRKTTSIFLVISPCICTLTMWQTSLNFSNINIKFIIIFTKENKLSYPIHFAITKMSFINAIFPYQCTFTLKFLVFPTTIINRVVVIHFINTDIIKITISYWKSKSIIKIKFFNI